MLFDLAGPVDDPVEHVDPVGIADLDLAGFGLASPVDPSTSGRLAFRGLLLSCRAIYAEASALLFSANQFVIHYRHGAQRSLQPLRNLTASSLAALASLKIVLNQSSCHHRQPDGDGLGTCCRGTDARGYSSCDSQHTTRHDSPLQSGYAAARPMLGEWLQTVEFLSLGIRPRALELSLVCDLDEREDADIATKVIAPLSLLPELKGCHIRLCRSPNAQLGQLARRAALQACYRPEPASPPSLSSICLLSLPRELRLRILEYTDLVTAWRQVVWARLELERGYLRPEVGCCIWDYTPCPPALHHGCQFSECYNQEYIKDGVVVYSNAIGCFCRVRHAAFSSSCRCWAPPTPLFLISHTILDDARFVFFSQNRFIVNDTLASHAPYIAFDVFKTIKVPVHHEFWEMDDYIHAQPPNSYPAERFAASHFLRHIVPTNCLGYLRFLEIVFPPYNHACWPHEDHPALQDWVATIDWVRNKINTPGLTLRLTMAGVLALPPSYPDERKLVTQAQGDEVLAGYDHILKPLACLGEDGLARFYADFAWPWKWVRPVYDGHGQELTQYEHLLAWAQFKEEVLNERAMRFILEDRYDRIRRSEGTLEVMPWTIHCMPSY